MANSILIKFPISSVQYENEYMLGLEMDYRATLEADIRNDGAFVESGSTNDVVVFEGILNGDTIVQTDSRDTIYEPLVTSKLKFNLVTHNFPSWLIEESQYYLDIRCVLALKGDKGQWLEQWRGYLWGNTLNSMVVNDYISTPLFAIDELGMSKYLKLYNTIGEYGKSRKLWNYFAYYKSLNDSYFGHIYTYMDIPYSSDVILWDSPYCLHDSSDNEISDFLQYLNFDSYGYVFQKEEDRKTWKDFFGDVCQYFNLTFTVGSHGSTANDMYLLETADVKTRNGNYTRTWHNNEYATATTTSTTGVWTTIVPNEKANADFNMTLEPNKYKGVKVKSEIKRYEAHTYLEDDNLEYYDKDKYVLHRWGLKGETASTISTYCIGSPKYHKLYYMKPTTEEDDYISTATENIDSGNNYNAKYLIDMGYIQADLNAQNYNYPSAKDNLSFLLTKMGGAIVKLGEFDMREATEDENLDNYLILMNHKWIHAGWEGDSIAALDNTATYALLGDNFESVSFKPFGHHQIRHNNEEHWLKIDYNLQCLNENIGELDRVKDVSPYHIADMRGSEALAMPSQTTDYEYNDNSKDYGSEVGSYYDGQNIDGYPPIIKWKGQQGSFKLNNGMWTTGSTDNGTNIQHWPEGYDKCVYAISANTDSFGYRFCPYYQSLRPKSGGGKKDYLLDMYRYGSPNMPLDGVLSLSIMSPSICFDWKNGKIGYLNNIFYLLNQFEFKFTDEAEIMNKPTEYEEQDVYDATSKTKQVHEITYNLSTPQYDGLFYNCFQYTPDNKIIANARKFYEQGKPLNAGSMEYFGVRTFENYDAPAPMSIQLTKRFNAVTDGSILWNTHILIDDIMESPYTFEVKNKTIYINRDLVKYDADRVFDDPWTDMAVKPNNPSHQTLPVDNNEY